MFSIGQYFQYHQTRKDYYLQLTLHSTALITFPTLKTSSVTHPGQAEKVEKIFYV